MINSFTPIDVLERETVDFRAASGLIIPMHESRGLRIVDCADDRGLTADYYSIRTDYFQEEVSPGRYFGAASGVALAALITIAAERGDAAMQQFVNDFRPEGFVDFASNLSDRANKLSKNVQLNQHSDDSKESSKVELADHKECENPLGCAFAHKMGAILLGANQSWQVTEARNILTETGSNLPIESAIEGITIMQRHINPDFSIHRGALHYSQTKTPRHTPVAIHEGHHAANEKTALVIDMAGYRSNANRHNNIGLPRYHQTLDIPVELMPNLMPEIKLNPSILKAAGLLLATSTRLALSGANTPGALRIEVIPADYKRAA